MTSPGLLWYYLWIAPHVLQGIILFVMIRRKLYQQFPAFFLYAGFEMFQFVALFTMGHSSSVSVAEYNNVFSVGSAVSTALRFAIIYEIFVQVFSNYSALVELGKVLFRWAAVVLFGVAVALAASTSGSGANRVMAAVSTLDLIFSMVQCGLLLFLFLFARYFALSWRSYVFGMALGFGAFASVELATSAIRAEVGQAGNSLLDYVTMGTYHCCVLIWMSYLLAPERKQQYALKKLPEHELDVWNKELKRLLQQ